MNRSAQRRRVYAPKAAATAAVAFALLAVGGCGNAALDASSDRTATAGSSSSAASVIGSEADVQFAQSMIAHLDQAVQMSTMLLAKRGVNEDVSAVAKRIKATQEPQIATLNEWLTNWGRPFGSANGNEADEQTAANHHAGNGLMTPLDMQTLDMANAAAGQKLFLEGMITHHQGAVVMAEAEIKDGKHPDAVQFARDIATTQNNEIATLKGLLVKR